MVETSEKGDSNRGGICSGNHHLTDPVLAHFAFMHVQTFVEVKCTRKVPIFEGCVPRPITPDMTDRKPTSTPYLTAFNVSSY